MGWCSGTDDQNRKYELDRDAALQVITSSANSIVVNDRSDFDTDPDNPSFRIVTFNQRGAHDEILEKIDEDIASFDRLLQQNAAEALEWLVMLRGDGMAAQNGIAAKNRAVSRRTMNQIGTQVQNAQNWAALTGTILVTCSVMIPNPVLAGIALGAGSVAVGTTEYSKSANVGAGVIAGGSTLIAGLIPFSAAGVGVGGAAVAGGTARTATVAEARWMFIAGASVSTAGSVGVASVSGEDVDTALVNALASTVLAGAAGGIVDAAKGRLTGLNSTLRVPIEVAMDVTTSSANSSAASDFAEWYQEVVPRGRRPTLNSADGMVPTLTMCFGGHHVYSLRETYEETEELGEGMERTRRATFWSDEMIYIWNYVMRPIFPALDADLDADEEMLLVDDDLYFEAYPDWKKEFQLFDPRHAWRL